MSKVVLWGIVALFVGVVSYHVAGPLILAKIQNTPASEAPEAK